MNNDWLKQVLEEADREATAEIVKDRADEAKRQAIEAAQRSGDPMEVLRLLRAA